MIYAYDGEFAHDPAPYIEPPRILLWAFVLGCILGVLLPFPTTLL